MYTRPGRNKTINSELFRIIKKRLVDDFEVVETNEVVFMFLEKATSQTKDQIFDKRTILKSVEEHFGGVVKLWSSKISSFLFNENVEKGRIIEVLLHELKRLEEKLKPASCCVTANAFLT